MKYIKLFNEELKSDTYFSAAKRLKSRHPGRSKKLDDHGDEIRRKEEEEEKRKSEEELREKWLKNIEKYSPFGIIDYKFEPSGEEYGGIIECYPIITFYNDGFLGNNFDFDETVTLQLDVILIPANEEALEHMEGIEDHIDDFYNKYMISFSRVYISIDLYNDSFGNLEFNIYETDDFYGSIEIADRKSAVRFKNILKSIFINKTYPDFSKFDSVYSRIQASLAETGISSDFGLASNDIYKLINNLSVNDLYKE